MPLRALIFDFRILAPLDINYVKVQEVLTKETAPPAAPAGRMPNIFDQISSLISDKEKNKIPAKKYEELLQHISHLLDESEEEQIGRFPLHMGVKNGLASVKPMKLALIATTEIGTKAAEKFVQEKEIKSYFSEIASRNELKQAADFSARLKPVLEKLKLKPEECIYFCNRMRDLKAGQVLGLRVVVMPGKNEQIDLLLRANPEGMIINLEELPTMLSLKSFKGSEEKRDEVGKGTTSSPKSEGQSSRKNSPHDSGTEN
jgi:phosphoglycolate phosphatase-like HAD superfamily hydrolase